MFEEFAMGAVGPDDEIPSNVVSFTGFVPKQGADDEEVKQKVALSNEVGGRKVSNIIDVMEDDEKLAFVIQDILPDTGLVYFGGLSGTGKTILAIQVTANTVLGRPTMTWQLGEAHSENFIAMMLSLEMGKKELQLRLQHQFPNLTEEETGILRERFLCYTEPEPMELWNPVHVLELTRMIKRHNVRLLLIDSASVSFAQSLKDDAQVNESIKNLYMLRSRLNVAMIVVAHTRKPPPGIASNPEDVTLNELFGHSGVAQSASAIIIMMEDEKARKATTKNGSQEKDEKLVHIINAKSRFGANAGSFKSYLTSQADVQKGEPLMFKRNAIPIAMTDDQKRKARQVSKTLSANDLKDVFSQIDLGSDLTGDE